MRGTVRNETVRKEREALVVTEIPYQVNKATMIEKIAELVRDKRIEGISDIRDESDRDGMRVVIELKRDAVSDVILNQLYRFSPLQTSFGANLVALNSGRPETMNLKDMLQIFVAYREEVVSKRTKYLLRRARDRAHILVGLAIAVANIDEVIRLIRTSPDPSTARAGLMSRDWPARDVEPLVALIADPRHLLSADLTIKLSDEQARAILDLRLQRLTALGRDEIGEELNGLATSITDYLEILRSRQRIYTIVKDELAAIREEFATPRRTEIAEGGPDLEDEDFIQREDMVVTVSHAGYIKRVPLATYRSQRRGGKGRTGMVTRDEDFVARLFVANTHTPVLFFSSRGIVYKHKVWRLPLAAPQARGKALINLLPLEPGERITTIMPLPEDEESWGSLDVMFSTTGGTVRRNRLSDFVDVRSNGKIAMKLAEGEAIVGVETCTEDNDIVLTSSNGQCIRFRVTDVRVFKGRDSTGVRGLRMAEGNRVISMAVVRHFEATPAERMVYLKMSRAVRGEADDSGAPPEIDIDGDAVEASEAADLSQERYAQMSASEEFLLTLSERGFGKRSSIFEYRVAGRGGKGIAGMIVNERNGNLVASFPVEQGDQIMLVTDGGQVIRVPVDDIRIVGRNSQGVTVFTTSADENVVAVEHLAEPEPEEAAENEDGPDGAADGDPAAP